MYRFVERGMIQAPHFVLVAQELLVAFQPVDRYRIEIDHAVCKPSNFTLRNYFSMLNYALNAAVREDLLRDNLFNKIDKRDKIKEPQ